MRLFFPLSKVEENPDGTLTVEGVASSEEMDSDGEVVRAEAIRKALPDFFRFGTGALREMHQPLAAGTVDAAQVGEDGCTYVTATVVDPVAIRKVQSGVYKGFSIGGRVKARDGEDRTVITEVGLSEISLVDRPANPRATISLWKGEAMQEQTEATNGPGPERAQAVRADDAAVGGDAPRDADAAMAEAEAAVTALEAAVAEANPDGGFIKDLRARFAAALASLSRLVARDEAWKSDGSRVPGRLRAWLAEGAALVGQMGPEEATGLFDMGKAAEVAAERDEALAKLAERDEALAKLGRRIEPLVEAVDGLAARLAEQAERLRRLEDQPETPKYMRVRTVEKSEDRSAPDEVAPVSAADAIKKAHRAPMRMLSY